MQLDIYAKYTNQDNIERENTYARAVCSDDLYDVYYSGNDGNFVYSIVASTILIPLMSFIILVISIRKLDSSTVNSFTKPSNHSHLVGLAFIGMTVSFFIIICNILACRTVARNNHEYAMEVTKSSINLGVVYVTLVFNILFTLPSCLCVFYIFYINIIKFCNCEDRCLSRNFLRNFFRVLIGGSSLKKIEKLSDNEIVAVIFPVVFVTPVLCISSHIGYIMLAWVTEPGKSTANFILYYFILVYLYLAFRKLYTLHSKRSASIKHTIEEERQDEPRVTSSKEDIKLDVIRKDHNTDEQDSIMESTSTEPKTCVKTSKTRNSCVVCGLSYTTAEKDHINAQAFCLLFLYAFFVVGFSAVVIFIFLLLPIASANLITYVFNALQLIIVLFSTQFAIKVFFTPGFDLKEAIESFIAYYTQKKDANKDLKEIAKKESVELEEITGAFVAEFTEVVIHKGI